MTPEQIDQAIEDVTEEFNGCSVARNDHLAQGDVREAMMLQRDLYDLKQMLYDLKRMKGA